MMKNVLAAAITSAALLTASGALADGGPAPEPPPPPPVYEAPPPVYNWYTTVFAGVACCRDLETDVTFIDAFDPADDEFFSFERPLKTGYLLGWTIGYRPVGLFGSDWLVIRPEAELSFRQRDVDFEEFFGFDDNNGDFIFNGFDPFEDFSDPVDTLSLMFNGWIDFNFAGVQPYIGGGIGVAWSDIPLPGPFLPHLESTDFAWQAGGGINFDLNERVFIGVGYRYFSSGFDKDVGFLLFSDDIGFPEDIIVPIPEFLEDVEAINFDLDSNTHEVLLNLGVRF